MSRLCAWGLASLCIAVVLSELTGQAGQDDPAPETWASKDLPVTRGLTLWLDASRIAESRKDRALPAVKDGGMLENWFDASGRGNHVSQQDVAAQPQYLPTPGLNLVRFDGSPTADPCIKPQWLPDSFQDSGSLRHPVNL